MGASARISAAPASADECAKYMVQNFDYEHTAIMQDARAPCLRILSHFHNELVLRGLPAAKRDGF
jgi:hypothetical protein